MKLALVESMQYYAVSCSTIFGWFHHVSPTFCLCIPRILISPDFTYISHPSCLNHGMIPPTTPTTPPPSTRQPWAVVPETLMPWSCYSGRRANSWNAAKPRRMVGGVFKMNLPNFPIKIRLEYVFKLIFLFEPVFIQVMLGYVGMVPEVGIRISGDASDLAVCEPSTLPAGPIAGATLGSANGGWFFLHVFTTLPTCFSWSRFWEIYGNLKLLVNI